MSVAAGGMRQKEGRRRSCESDDLVKLRSVHQIAVINDVIVLNVEAECDVMALSRAALGNSDRIRKNTKQIVLLITISPL